MTHGYSTLTRALERARTHTHTRTCTILHTHNIGLNRSHNTKQGRLEEPAAPAITFEDPRLVS